MTDHHISIPKVDLIMAMDDLRLSGRDYSADLLNKALFSSSVGAEPVGLSLEVRTLGSYGKAFDLPGNRRAYTYDHQPGNVEASRLGTACQQAVASSAGDYIDRGLSLLKELQAQGFGVFEVDASRWHAAPVVAQQPISGVEALPPFAVKVIEKLKRFEETCMDGQDSDIGKHWLDLLTQLGLLNRVRRSPAYWEIAQQGEDVLSNAIAQQDANKVDADPLQGAADWLVKDCGVSDPAGLANRLRIGYNRACRLVDAARKEPGQ